MKLLYFISWMLVQTSVESLSRNSCPLHLISCTNITTSSGQIIEQMPKRISKWNGRNRGPLKHFGSSTSHVICTLPSCLVSPCKNDGLCLETEDSFTCVCPDGYFGDRCQDIPKTCVEVKTRNWTQNGTYLIDPDGPNGNLTGPITVQCKDGTTIIRHDIIGNQVVPRGYERPGSYQQDVEYSLPMAAIVAIMMNSDSCRQYVRATCHKTYIYAFNQVTQNVYWISRQGMKMPNWGGVPSDTKGCLCGLRGDCFGNAPYCNCVGSNRVWLTDDGYLTDTDRLPVIRLHFGDTGRAHEMMNYELGFLECE